MGPHAGKGKGGLSHFAWYREKEDKEEGPVVTCSDNVSNISHIFYHFAMLEISTPIRAKAFIIIFFKVGSIPCMEPNAGTELMKLRSRPELRSRVALLTNCVTQVPRAKAFLHRASLHTTFFLH